MRSRNKIGSVGATCVLVASVLGGCGSDDATEGGQAMADRMSHSTLESLAEASQFAVVGEVIGSDDAVSTPLVLDPDDPAYPYEPGYEPTEEELSGSAIPAVIEGVFWQEDDTFVNTMSLTTTTPPQAQALFD